MEHKDYAVSFIIVIVLMIVIAFTVSTKNSLRKDLETLEETHMEKVWALEEERDNLYKELDSVYENISKTESCSSTLFHYFDEQSVSFEEASDAFDDLSQLLSQYY